MTLYSPVVFSDDPVVQEAARARSWRVVERHPDNPRVLRMAHATDLAAIPHPKFTIPGGSLNPEAAPVWKYVLNWLERFVFRPLPIVAPNDYATDLALWAASSRGWPIGALVTEPNPILSPQAVALLTAADGMFGPFDGSLEALESTWIGPVRRLPDTPLVEVSRRVEPAPHVRRAGRTSVLVVAYYAGPSSTVGVQRINHWFERLPQLSDGRVSVDLVCATPWDDAPDRVHVVRDLGSANLATEQGPLNQHAAGIFERVAHSAYDPQGQVAGLWHHALERYFEARTDEYDVVLISGNPFPPFEFAKYAKRRWYAKVILDYRDPFTRSPRFGFSEEATADARSAEVGWNLTADLLTVVNTACAELMVPSGPDQRIAVVPNGFDERLPRTIRPAEREPGPVRAIHAGQTYDVTPVSPLLAAIEASDAVLDHYGPALPGAVPASVRQHGRIPRPALMERLASADCGITWVNGSGFETATKVFDYLAAGLDIVVLHHGMVRGSALFEMLEGVAGVHWVANEQSAIEEFLISYRPTRHDTEERSAPFSRAESAKRLVEILEELGDHSYEFTGPGAASTP